MDEERTFGVELEMVSELRAEALAARVEQALRDAGFAPLHEAAGF